MENDPARASSHRRQGVLEGRLPQRGRHLSHTRHSLRRSFRSLARNLSRVLVDTVLRQNLIAAGKQRAARFTWAASAEANRRVYASVI